MRCADFLVCWCGTGTAFIVGQQNGAVMALIQTERDNIVHFTGSLRQPIAIGPLARQVMRLFEHVLSFVRQRLARLARWSAQRSARNGFSMAERARQRRALAQLSDRELRDIGITRYDIEFVLRHPRRR
jgi:uncharacterized protein YjiS (DUF1127 family)